MSSKKTPIVFPLLLINRNKGINHQTKPGISNLNNTVMIIQNGKGWGAITILSIKQSSSYALVKLQLCTKTLLPAFTKVVSQESKEVFPTAGTYNKQYSELECKRQFDVTTTMSFTMIPTATGTLNWHPLHMIRRF